MKHQAPSVVQVQNDLYVWTWTCFCLKQFKASGHSQVNSQVPSIGEIKDNVFGPTPYVVNFLEMDQPTKFLGSGCANGSRPQNRCVGDAPADNTGLCERINDGLDLWQFRQLIVPKGAGNVPKKAKPGTKQPII